MGISHGKSEMDFQGLIIILLEPSPSAPLARAEGCKEPLPLPSHSRVSETELLPPLPSQGGVGPLILPCPASLGRLYP